MRISDWSSDVCSSDLQGQPRLPDDRGAALEQSGIRQGRAVGPDRRARARPDLADARRRQHPAVRRRVRDEHLAQPRQAARLRPVGQPGAGRSEEHTSELQSLMRISYAVFCLKKKTKKTEK